MKKSIIFVAALAIISAFSSCKEENILAPSDRISSVKYAIGESEYNDAYENRSSESSDPFVLDGIVQNGNLLNITVSYSGGCEEHTFDFIWDGVVTNSEDNSPEVNFIIQHNANGDACEAWITEVIIIDLTDLSDSIYYPDINIDIYNGGSSDDSLYYGGGCDPYVPFEITESETCNMTVVAENVICGNGLWENMWFAIENGETVVDDSSNVYTFNYYLQPLGLDESLQGFTPIAGKKYSIGVVTADPTEYPEYYDDVICMAYVGPSIPVKIMCITEIE
ncbi:MAG TPA: hypothetical protein DDX39_06600 [Bacteroidales bacterium]|nr:MAG: hypothetical protein A2W98_11360 [Bacteroidetes bacterium GWF2_33_38]OFY76663.1 MAG: hypothetical protein A2265_08890 [Bacteroidetes bacterium RIFOXYA12_FULL_33_9]OFY86775.1 MAG: hypothetical protein A2236_10500 [Bacteroidetes bacterium RIFOXYA2_FULL_33_7]HBF88296.1 hypothetical protein [Bacteroidales bacterium]